MAKQAAPEKSFVEGFELCSVGALLTLPDGSYLMQLRDNRPDINMPDHWGLFGGWSHPDEPAHQTLERELNEELGYQPSTYDWFTEIAYLIPHFDRPPVHKSIFHVPVTEDEIAGMAQTEGADMRPMPIETLMALPNVMPWDLFAVLCHAREDDIRIHHPITAVG